MKKKGLLSLLLCLIVVLAVGLTACKSECEKNGHVWDEGVVTTAPTCTQDGVKTFTCKVDSTHTKTEAIPATGHAASTEWTKDATDHWHTCANDATEQLDKAAHTYGAWQVTLAPTCTVAGSHKKTCSECGYEVVEVMPATGHATATEWTKDETSHWHVCANDATEQLDKADHTYGDWVVTLAPTCIAEGSRKKACSVCGYEVVEAIAIDTDAHDWNEGEVTLDPTYTATGEKTFTCKRNPEHTYKVVIPKLIPTVTFSDDTNKSDIVLSVTANGQSIASGAEVVYDDAIVFSYSFSNPGLSAAYEFKGWYDKNTNQLLTASDTYSIAHIKESVVIEARFESLCYVDVKMTGEAGIGGAVSIVNQADGASITNKTYVHAGTVLVLTATPNATSGFESWTIGEEITPYSRVITYTVSKHVVVNAKFISNIDDISATLKVTDDNGGYSPIILKEQNALAFNGDAFGSHAFKLQANDASSVSIVSGTEFVSFNGADTYSIVKSGVVVIKVASVSGIEQSYTFNITFTKRVAVTYFPLDQTGAITAEKVESESNVAISSGAALNKGDVVKFTATPADDTMEVAKWYVNGVEADSATVTALTTGGYEVLDNTVVWVTWKSIA